VRYGNKYFDMQQPRITWTEARETCGNALFVCVRIISNLAVLLNPFLPFSSGRLFSGLELITVWKPQYVSEGYVIPETPILFERLDKRIIDEELSRIGKQTYYLFVRCRYIL